MVSGRGNPGQARTFFGGISVVEAEAQVVIFGLQLAADLGISLIEVETDCQALVTLLKSNPSILSYVGTLCENISEIVELVGVVSLNHCPRVCNSVAYRLAQTEFSLEIETRWMADASTIIHDILMEDSL